METPGGGGYGKCDEETKNKMKSNLECKSLHTFTERGSVFEYRKSQESG
jgi:N-methylhydantoinase B/oxoprolinase/acetone carboxylase alpha subunit